MQVKIKTRKSSMYTKTVASFLIIAILSTLLVGGVSIYSLWTTRDNSMEENLLNITKSAATMIDKELHVKFINGEVDQEAYSKEQQQLAQLAEAVQSDYIYSLINKDGATAFIMDSGDPESYGIAYETNPVIEAAFNGTEGVSDEYTDEYGTFISAYVPLKDTNGNIIAIVGADYNVEKVKNEKMKTLIYIIPVGVFAILLAVGMSLILGNNLRKPVVKVIRKLSDIVESSGDLTQRVDIHTGDEYEIMGEHINHLIQNIEEIVKMVITTSDEGFGLSHELKQGSKDMFALAEQQAQSMKELALTTEQMASSISIVAEDAYRFVETLKEATDNGSVAKEVMNEMVSVSEAGKISMDQLFENMTKITDTVHVLNNGMAEVGNSTGEIRNIIQLIESISQQTNLLALNASIEAARAGQAGKGFAVVAEEIRKLAESSTSATNTISGLIKKVEKSVTNAISEMNMSMKIIEAGTGITQNTSETFMTIYTAIQETNILIQDILQQVESVNELGQDLASVTEEQSASAQEILATSEGVTEMAQNILHESSKVTDNSEHLIKNSEDLKNIISKFTIE